MIKNRFAILLLFGASISASDTTFNEKDGFTTDLVKLRSLVASHPREMLNERFLASAIYSFEHAIRFKNETPGDSWHYPTAIGRLEILHNHHRSNGHIPHRFLHNELISCSVNSEVIAWFLAHGYDPNYVWTRTTVAETAGATGLVSMLLQSILPRRSVEVVELH